MLFDLLEFRPDPLFAQKPEHNLFSSQMPYMTGTEVARALRSANDPIYITGCTGNALAEDQAEYLQAGADCILTKPVRLVGIEEALVAAAVRRRERG